MDKYKSLLTNIGLFGISSIAVKAITFFLVPLYTYYLTVDEFGITDMFTLVITRFGPLLIVESQRALLRFGYDDSENKKDYTTVVFWLTVAGSLLAAVLLPLLDLPIFGGLGEYKLIFWFSISLSLFQQFFDKIARILNQVILITWASIMSALSTMLSAVIFLPLLGKGLDGFFYSFIVGSVVGCIFYVVKGGYYSFIGSPINKKLINPMRKLLHFGFPLLLTTISWGINNVIASRFIIISFLGIGASGLYAAATKIPNLVLVATSIFQDAWNLSAFQEYKHNNITKYFNTVYNIFNSLILLIVSTIIFSSQWLAVVILQKDFYSAWQIIPILVWALYYGALYTFYESIYMTKMKTSRLSYSLIIGMSVCVLLTFLGVKYIGILGAAFGLLVSNFVIWIIRVFDSKSLINISHRVELIIPQQILLAALSMMAAFTDGTELFWIRICLYFALLALIILQLYPSLKNLVSFFKNKRKMITE